MKRNFYLKLTGLLLLASSIARSQCTVSELAIQLHSAVPVPGGCQVVFDFSWTQEVNAGNKFAYVHLWNTAQYPALEANGLAYSPTSNYPDNADLVNALATIVINGNGTATPVIGTSYHPQPSVPALSAGVSVKKVPIDAISERMTVKNIQLLIPDCSGSGITGDIWASQAENGKNVHCVSSDVSIVVGNPRVTGLLYCAIPRQYSVQINNLSAVPISSSYDVYIDDGDGIFEPVSHELKITPASVGPLSIAAGSVYNSGKQSYMPYAGQIPYANRSLWVEVTTTGAPNTTLYLITNTCIGLPVTYLGFTAQRNQSNVILNWETGSEMNNAGFEVQRKTVNGEFSPISFVRTHAIGGNSESRLSYSYIDVNLSRGVTEYRLKQVDINGESKYSAVRAVRGMGQDIKLTVYPNPSTDGNVNVLLDEAGKNYGITLVDANGRVIGKWTKATSNLLPLRGLKAGSYFLRIDDPGNSQSYSLVFVVLSK